MSSTKSVLITGCSPGGIGYSLARQLHSKGLRVYATARREEGLKELQALGITTFVLDVTNVDNIKSVVAEVSRRGGLDILVNNAGRTYVSPAIDLDISEVKAVFEANIFAVMQMCREFAPLLISSKGLIVNMGSAGSRVPNPFSSCYNASKGALEAYNDTLRVELAPFHVRVLLVSGASAQTGVWKYPVVFSEDSRYKIVENEVRSLRAAVDQGCMTSDEFVSSLVPYILRHNVPTKVHLGTRATLFWILTTFFPKGIFDFITSRLPLFKKLKKHLKAE